LLIKKIDALNVKYGFWLSEPQSPEKYPEKLVERTISIQEGDDRGFSYHEAVQLINYLLIGFMI
jgi:hypothetical protein